MTAISIKEKAANVRSMIERSRGQIAAALPKHLTAERMMRVCNTAISKTPQLLDCDPRTLIGAIVQASQLGLEPEPREHDCDDEKCGRHERNAESDAPACT